MLKNIFPKINIRRSSGFLLAIFSLSVFFILPSPAGAITESVAGTSVTEAAMAASFSANSAADAAIISTLRGCLASVGITSSGALPITAAQEAAMKSCMNEAEITNRKLLESTLWNQVKAGDIKQDLRDKVQEALAIAFKTSLKTFARQVAHDTAVWVASGGKGQKPLFITEGWGAYLKNTADSALGDFIDGVGSQFGMDLCQPNFQVRLAIKAGLDYTKQRHVRCTFSQISANWQSAINNASFAVEYREFLRTGANDISYALVMADQRNSYVADKLNAATKEAETNSLWKDIKNIAGQILTPGTLIANQFRQSQAKADIGYATFTNTVADIIEEFLNTLVSQLIKNLQRGLFSGSGGDKSTAGNLANLSGLASLFNPYSSPIVSGIEGAKMVFANLVESQTKVGNKVDILLKLSTCSDQAKANPGPTDCVIDSLLADAIKNKKYVADLDQSIKNRIFAPQINAKNSLDTTIPARSIMIMRKYRIVPIGWEFAADIIKNSPSTTSYTLGDIMNCFYGKGYNGCVTDDFKGLVDPYWVLKAPETFCRRIGYTGYNAFKKEQNSIIQRNQDCVDEQQCLAEDVSGNCQDYGYCTEERRTWDLGTVCEAKYNTCTTFISRSNQKANWLADTLDFGNCDSQNAGCRSYATNYNYESKSWNGDLLLGNGVSHFSGFRNNGSVEVTLDVGWRVLEGHTVSTNKRLVLGAACNPTNCGKISGCKWNTAGYCTVTGATCEVPEGGISCSTGNCYESASILASFNPNFEEQASGINAGDAKTWTDELSYSDINNRHYRAAGVGRSGYGLKAISANNTTELITTLPDIPLTAGQTYKLKFSIKGTISQGSIIVALTAGDSPYNTPNSSVALGGQSFVTNVSNWTEIEVPIINSGNFSTGAVVIVTPVGSVTNLTLDNFSLQKMKADCQAVGVKLFSATETLTSPTNIYFDRDTESCSASAMGCSQFIRTKADLGNNLLYNGGFEAGISGWQASLTLNNGGAAVLLTSTVAADRLLAIEPNSYYAIGYDAAQSETGASDSAIVKLTAYNSPNKASSQILSVETNCSSVSGNAVNLINSPTGQAYERKTCYFRAPADAHYLALEMKAQISKIFLDKIKLEKVSYPNFSATAYSIYDPSSGHTASQIAYLNQAPDYYGCYRTKGGAWPTTAFELNDILAKQAPECNSFAQVCLPQEVGCELYTPVNGDPEIPGIIDGLDLCPAECSGYQIYKQEATNFISSANFRQFIADQKAKYCSAAYAGCDEFTNLDELGKGAEKKEYYVSFKVCQRPSSDDASYYTWEGSDITGYQLKAFTLKKSQTSNPEKNSNGFAPCTNLFYNADGTNYCQDETVAHGLLNDRFDYGICTKEDMSDNSDCRELYDTEGNVHYRLLSKTVTVSDNCHPYRRTQTQTTTMVAQTDCQNTHGWWKAATGECIYMAIPQEGTVCSASVAGCRSYTGNRGNNVRNVLSQSDFTSATTSDNLWVDGSGNKSGLMISAEATYPGGNSLSNKVNSVDGTGVTNNIIKHPVTIIKNRTYTLSFWAKGNQSFYPQSIAIVSNGVEKEVFSAARLAGENLLSPRVLIGSNWQNYDLGPIFITWEPTVNDYLVFTLPGGAKIYLDNILLKELNNNVYVIENSWYTPVVCDNKLDDSDGQKAKAIGNCQDESTGRCAIGEMLGCTAYKNRSGQAWYLRSFNSLCRREAAGCEALISTQNSESALAETFNSGDIYSQVTVPADSLVYLVNDSNHTCSASDKGCSALGLPLVDKWDEVIGYKTVFLKNNPSRYATDLCQSNELWCEEYGTNNSLVYFKDPHGKTCDYSDLAGHGKGWYKTGTNEKCAPDSSELPTIVNGGSPNMVFGTGYEPAGEKLQPLGPYSNVLGDYNSGTSRTDGYSGWVGNCLQTQSGCSEYIDPYSSIYTNFLATKDIGKSSVEITLQGYVLYNLTNAAISVASPCQIYYPFGTDSQLVYLAGADNCTALISGAFGGSIDNSSKVSKAGVYYALAGSVDSASCNGTVDFKSGCLLLNSRNNINYNKTSTIDRLENYLVYDSASTYAENNPVGGIPKAVAPKLAATGLADSDKIIKAAANRTCDKWLECTTYQKTADSSQDYRFDSQDQCLNFSSCNFRNSDGSCGRYDFPSYEEVTKNNFSSNMTGFTIPDHLPVAAMDQFGNSASVPNGNFESILSNGEPLGWIMNASSSDLNNDGWKTYKYAIEGKQQYLKFDSGYLTVNSIYAVNSEAIDVQKGYYTLDLWVNTLDLKPESATARVFITSEKMNNGTAAGLANITLNDSNIKYVLMDGENWVTSENLKVAAGLGWKEITILLQIGQGKTTAAAKDTLKIKLMNFDDEARLAASGELNLDAAGTDYNYYKCYDLEKSASGSALPGKPNFDTPCNITGSSLFDNVYLKAALRANNNSNRPLTPVESNLPSSSELISRSCRAYPAQDARSCQYYQNNNFYYGWYGYCLMEDPDNPGQCLQWYPIDQLKGDVVDEYSGGYSEQMPLFYCAEVKKEKVKAQVEDFGANIGGGLLNNLIGDVIPGLGEAVTSLIGENGKAIPFKLTDPATSHLFRYPIISRFGVAAAAIGGGTAYGEFGIGGMFFYGTMEKYYSCLNFSKGSSCRRASSSVSDGSVGSSLLQALYNTIAQVTSVDINTIMGSRLSSNSVWGGWGAAVPAAIQQLGIGLPFAGWDLVENKIMGSGSSGGSALDNILQQVGIEGVFGDGSVMGAKIVTDEDNKYASKFTDPNSGIAGDILGAVWGVKLGSLALFDINGINITGGYDAYYCTKVVQVVTAAGQNKAWANRISKASQFTFLPSDKPQDASFAQDCGVTNYEAAQFFINPYCLNVPGAIDGIDADNLGYQFNGYIADYKPFGAIVTPNANLQNPYLWDTYSPENTIDLSRQPLYWEPPFLSLLAPYQPRMGQPVKVSGLQNLFAKAYAAWKWVETDETDSKTAGYYQAVTKKNDAADYGNFIWDTPTNYCDATWVRTTYQTNGFVRDMNDRAHFCLIAPTIITMSVNSSTAANLVLENARPAKLDFTVRVDRDQLPLTSYLVEWGDGDLNNTAVTGVKLRARAKAENPFTLYHLYEVQKIRDAASGCANFSSDPNNKCYLSYCAADSCFVKIRVTVVDNWRAEGSRTTPFIIQIKN